MHWDFILPVFNLDPLPDRLPHYKENLNEMYCRINTKLQSGEDRDFRSRSLDSIHFVALKLSNARNET